MALITRNKATTAPSSLVEGELGVRTANTLALFVGDSSSVQTLLGAPVAVGGGTNETLRYGGTEWVSASNLLITTTGGRVPSGGVFEVYDGASLRFGDDNDLQIESTGSNILGTIDDTFTFKISDGTGDRLRLDTSGDIHFYGNQIHNAGTAFNVGFDRFNRLTQAAYDALVAGAGTDPDTVYILTAA